MDFCILIFQKNGLPILAGWWSLIQVSSIHRKQKHYVPTRSFGKQRDTNVIPELQNVRGKKGLNSAGEDN